MVGFVLRRLLQAVPIVLVLTFVIFLLLHRLPGDPTFAILGEQATAEQRAALREELQLDRPAVVQYWAWLTDVLRGDLGNSFRTDEPVVNVLKKCVPVTLELSALALLLGVGFGIPLGLVSARRRGSVIDIAVSSASVSFLALPYFVIAAVLVLIFAVQLKLVPPSGYVPFHEDPIENLRLMALPAIALGTSITAVVSRQARAAFVNVMAEPYFNAAVVKGISKRRLIFRHLLKAAALPIVTVVGLQAGNLVAGSVIMETVFAMPGLGRLLVRSILDRDFAVVQGAVIFIAFAVLVINLATDLLYAYLDPRIRHSNAQQRAVR